MVYIYVYHSGGMQWVEIEFYNSSADGWLIAYYLHVDSLFSSKNDKKIVYFNGLLVSTFI